MDSKNLKNVFGDVAKENGFSKAFGGWFRESQECILVLDLQKSNFGDYYYLNLKIFIQGIFKNIYSKNKNLVKDTGDVFRRRPAEYNDIFNFDIISDDAKRISILKTLFTKFISSFADKALSKKGIKVLEEERIVFLLPAIKENLVVTGNTLK